MKVRLVSENSPKGSHSNTHDFRKSKRCRRFGTCTANKSIDAAEGVGRQEGKTHSEPIFYHPPQNLHEDKSFCGRSRNMSQAVRDIANETQFGLEQ